MASLLRQIVAGPRARHPEAGLDLCYVTDNIIATSGPSGAYPQRAYRNPLDSLVKFLDYKHGDDWAIWEFRAEGTGYPDSEVYNRVYHYPFPDHHPPPFALIPNIMASMRNWLHEKEGRVVVVHCKAGKGRSGTASCSYLISEEGWPIHKALQRFTERRMRPNMGKGVSIPSQLRWIDYVDRWAKHDKIYVERQVEVTEVHCWGLRDGVKIQIEGFVEDGKVIKRFHTFSRDEREVVRGEVKDTGMVQAVQEVMYKNGIGRSTSRKGQAPNITEVETEKRDQVTSEQTLGSRASLDATSTKSKDKQPELGTGDVVFRPSKRVVLPTNDINIDIERRNSAAFDLTMVTAVAHVWFNAFFEGNGPEQKGIADDSGVFTIKWDAMDGIKGSSRKGTQAFEKISLVWRALKSDEGRPGTIITEPREGEEVKQSTPADWKGARNIEPSEGKDIGLRTSSPTDSNTNISKANSFNGETSNEQTSNMVITAPGRRDSDDSDTKDVQPHGPNGEPVIQDPLLTQGSSGSGSGPQQSTASENSTSSPTSPSPIAGSSTPAELITKNNTNSRQQSPESLPGSHHQGLPQVYNAVHISTSDLPDGMPEDEMKKHKDHRFGHVGKMKTSS